LRAMFQLVNGISFDEANAAEFEDMKDSLEDMLSEMGYEVNLDGLDKDMKPEELAAKLAELQKTYEQQAEANEQKEAKRKKTKKQLEREQKEKLKEEAKKKSIGTIYKQLAKILHPDLENDPIQKALKEEVMKQLTNAYESNDLHTLLRLEIEWMEKQEKNIASLTDDKLSVYNEVLKEQVAELEESIYELAQHPRYMPLYRFTDYDYLVRAKTLANKKMELTEIINAINDTIRIDLSGSRSLMYVKDLAAYRIRELKYSYNMDDLLKGFMTGKL
jgi:hypothetical protein